LSAILSTRLVDITPKIFSSIYSSGFGYSTCKVFSSIILSPSFSIKSADDLALVFNG
jgi:hypothetical protein